MKINFFNIYIYIIITCKCSKSKESSALLQSLYKSPDKTLTKSPLSSLESEIVTIQLPSFLRGAILPENVKIISGIEFLCGGPLLFIELPQNMDVEFMLIFEFSQSLIKKNVNKLSKNIIIESHLQIIGYWKSIMELVLFANIF